jgi:hypothetical protein
MFAAMTTMRSYNQSNTFYVSTLNLVLTFLHSVFNADFILIGKRFSDQQKRGFDAEA